ncbi:MAG: DUF6714 family protein [Fimbriimonas sp.]
MDEELLTHLDDERRMLVYEIYAAFAGVTREGGVSWSEAIAKDLYLAPEECRAARELDREGSWKELADDPGWEYGGCGGAWAFLDPIGFRYYLPAAMIRCIRKDEDSDFAFSLRIPGPDEPFTAPDAFQGYMEKWSALDLRQRRCVKRFLRYMVRIGETRPAPEASTFESLTEQWQTALDSYWERVPDDPEPSSNGEDGALPAHLAAEREAVEREIYAAFAHVTLGKGVSWGETPVIDGYGTLEEQRKARRGWSKNAWEGLVDDPSWTTEYGAGSWSFLDPIGLRYYLPAGMIRCLRDEEQWEVLNPLTAHSPTELAYRLKDWAPLDLRQKRCIKRFLRFMIARGEYESILSGAEPWEGDYGSESHTSTMCREALAGYWNSVADEVP